MHCINYSKILIWMSVLMPIQVYRNRKTAYFPIYLSANGTFIFYLWNTHIGDILLYLQMKILIYIDVCVHFFQTYQPWVIKTYGDLAKTKTITIKKHQRILKALNGQEQNNPDSSKFRFWVKAKGEVPY